MPMTRSKKTFKSNAQLTSVQRHEMDTPRPRVSPKDEKNLRNLSTNTVVPTGGLPRSTPTNWDEDRRSVTTNNSQQEAKIQMLQFQMEHLKKEQELRTKRMQLEYEENQLTLEREIEMAKFEDDANIPND